MGGRPGARPGPPLGQRHRLLLGRPGALHVYVLLPICVVYALFLVWQGVPQNFSAYTVAHTLEGATQTIAQGPVASQEAIKMLGTNGGGFFNANSAHPFENPTPLSNFVEMLSIFLIGSALVYMFGKWVGNTRQGWAIWAAMFVLFTRRLLRCRRLRAERQPAHRLAGARRPQWRPANQPGGNMEGKEVRFGIVDSALFATITTDASCGAVNAWHDSFTPHRRPGAADQHGDRRGDLRRRGRRSVRHADVRHPGRLHRRPDGGPHARVPGQEDRELRDQDGQPRRC